MDADPMLSVSATVDKTDDTQPDDALGFAVQSHAVDIIYQLMMLGVPMTPEAEELLKEHE